MIVYDEKLLTVMGNVVDLHARMKIYAIALLNLNDSGMPVDSEMAANIVRVSINDIMCFHEQGAQYVKEASELVADDDGNFVNLIAKANVDLTEAVHLLKLIHLRLCPVH